MDAFAGEIVEFPLQTIGVCIPFFIEKDVVVFICSFVFVIVRSCMHHDKRFTWLVGNHHILHHTYPNYNYGECWIDTLCGTKYTR
jgi:sterol desaturase/sphingolipid hydroxylase (fatty acid hydroxylase superfamily)